MLANGVHVGFRRQYWSPKMRDYLHGTQNGIYVFDLYRTIERLEAVRGILRNLQEHGKSVLIVGTKVQARELVKTFAERTNINYVNNKWVPGLLTNFATLKRRIASFNRLEEDLKENALDNLTKKERAQKTKELDKLRKSYEGVKDMKRLPDAILVIDGHYEALALREAKALGVMSIALLGSTGDIDEVSHFIPCNVNSPKALAYILGALEDVCKRSPRAESQKGSAPQATRKLADRPRHDDFPKKREGGRDSSRRPSEQKAPEAVTAEVVPETPAE